MTACTFFSECTEQYLALQVEKVDLEELLSI